MSSVAYKSLSIIDTTQSTSKTTGALTCSGGISTTMNVVSGGAIIADGTYPVKMYSTQPPNAGSTTKGGVLIMSDTNQGGIVNINNDSIAMGINVGSYFGTRDTTKQGGMVKINTQVGVNALDIVVQDVAGSEVTAFSIDTSGNALCRRTTSSTSTTTGSLVCSGGLGVAGNVNVGGTVSANAVSSSTTIIVNDGANEGTIDQVSTELTLSSSGNRIAIASSNTLEFKNDGTSQLTAYTAREIVDDCDVHTFIYNRANPSTLKYMLSSTYALNQVVPSAYAMTVNTIYAFPIRLIKGQIVNGAGFYLAISGSPQVGYALYNISNPSARLASTSTLTNATANGIVYLNFSSSYTVVTTGIHYVCICASNIGTSISLIAMATNTYINYGQSTMTNGVLNKAGQSCSSSSFPETLSGLAMTLLTRVGYGVVYTTTA